MVPEMVLAGHLAIVHRQIREPVDDVPLVGAKWARSAPERPRRVVARMIEEASSPDVTISPTIGSYGCLRPRQIGHLPMWAMNHQNRVSNGDQVKEPS
jgi:hypothetical protein